MPRRTFKCPQCPKSYGSQGKLDAHKRIHRQRPLVCHHCNRNFIDKRGISRHMQIHIVSNPSDHLQSKTLIPCRVCRKCFPTKEALNAHKAAHSTLYECDICKRSFSYKWRWVYHMTNGCTNRFFTCAHCMKKFKSKEQISVHIRSKHIKRHLYSCKFCTMSTNSKINYLYHVYRHTGEKGFVCSVCNKAFARHESLQNHKKEHTNDMFECDVCLKRFTRRFSLNTHRLLHTRQPRFFCKVCSIVFKYKYQLDAHLDFHDAPPGDDPPEVTIVKKEPGLSDTDTSDETKAISLPKKKKRELQGDKKTLCCPKCSMICQSEIGLKKHMSNSALCKTMAAAFATARDKSKKQKAVELMVEAAAEEEAEEEESSVPLKPQCYHFDYVTKQYVPLYTKTRSPANIIAPPIFPSTNVASQCTVTYNLDEESDELAADGTKLDPSRPNNRFLCLFCKDVFKTVSDLMEHTSVAHKEETLKIKQEKEEAQEEPLLLKTEPMSDDEYERDEGSLSDSEPPLLNVEVTMSDDNNSNESLCHDETRLGADERLTPDASLDVDPLGGPPHIKQEELEPPHSPPLLMIKEEEDDPSNTNDFEPSTTFRCADIQKILIKREGSLLKAILTESKDKERFCSPDVVDADDLTRLQQVDITCS